MTDNEKAATFIGWGREHTDSPTAPDMSDPRNYMKALEKRAWMIEGKRDWDYLLDSVYAALRAKDAWPIIKYLAALYDAEHKETE